MRTLALLAALVASGASLPSSGNAQDQLRTYGDSSLRDAIAARAQVTYDSTDKPDAKRVHVMTRDNPLSLAGAAGTEATGVFVRDVLSRIVATVWTNRGKYSVEYYQVKDGPFFVWESFVSFEDAAPRGAWRNFMGLPAWERRTYFNDDHRIVYAEGRGRGAPLAGSDAARLNNGSRRITALIRQHAGSATPHGQR
jgi:hypothetical protein